MKKTALLALLLSLSAGVSLRAEDSAKPAAEAKPGMEEKKRNPEDSFKRRDANSDGALSLDEFKAGRMGKEDPKKAEEVFKQRDKDGNGSLSLDEFKAAKSKPAGTDKQ